MTMKQWKCSFETRSRGRIVSYRASPPESLHATIFRFGREIDRFALQGCQSGQAFTKRKSTAKTDPTTLDQDIG